MLTEHEERQKATLLAALESAIGISQAHELHQLIELERKDTDPSHGQPFERGLPSLEERLAHPGPWESWESPMDRCIVWFSPDGTGYDVDYGNGCERKFHPITMANWESTWLRRMRAE